MSAGSAEVVLVTVHDDADAVQTDGVLDPQFPAKGTPQHLPQDDGKGSPPKLSPGVAEGGALGGLPGAQPIVHAALRRLLALGGATKQRLEVLLGAEARQDGIPGL